MELYRSEFSRVALPEVHLFGAGDPSGEPAAISAFLDCAPEVAVMLPVAFRSALPPGGKVEAETWVRTAGCLPRYLGLVPVMRLHSTYGEQ